MDREQKKVKPLKKNISTALSSISNELGKLPPQSVELEEAVLGAIMLDKSAITNVIEVLTTDSFYTDAHQKIYASILRLFDETSPIDILTVTQELRERGELEMAGGAYYISKLTSRVSSAANVEYHARIIAQNAIKRKLISIAGEILEDAYEDQTDVFELLDKSEASLFSVSENNIRRDVENIGSVIMKAKKILEERNKEDAEFSGVRSGFNELDKITGGWQKSDLVILAARPGMGKTAFVLSTLRNAAVDDNKSVAIFSLEMPAVQLANRLISSEAEIESSKLRHGKLLDHEWVQLENKVNNLSNARIFIDDTPALSIRELRTKCRRLKHSSNGVDLIIIDYLQLMTGAVGDRGGNREQEIASISRALKGIAKELDVPVIALAQLSRAVEVRGGDKKPMLSDLRESGSIEQDADMVLMLYRPEYYGFTTMTDENGGEIPAEGIGEVIIAKNRHGSTSSIFLRFVKQFTKFENLSLDFDNPFGEPQNLSSRMNQDSDMDGFGGLPDRPDPGDDDSDAPF